jgi:FMN-dependent NADH-azoreductase
VTLFRLDASIRVEGSISRAIADIVESEWRATGGGPTITRHVGTEPLPSTAWGDAVSAAGVESADMTEGQRDAVALAATLTDELVEADAYLFALPLYNFGISQHMKAWVDLVTTDPRMGPGSTVLEGRPAVLVMARGGSYAAGTPREGWDHASGWMRRILADVWQLDLTEVETEFTLAHVNPALSDFRQLADELRAKAEAAAAVAGRQLGERVASAAAR